MIEKTLGHFADWHNWMWTDSGDRSERTAASTEREATYASWAWFRYGLAATGLLIGLHTFVRDNPRDIKITAYLVVSLLVTALGARAWALLGTDRPQHETATAYAWSFALGAAWCSLITNLIAQAAFVTATSGIWLYRIYRLLAQGRRGIRPALAGDPTPEGPR